MCIGRLGMEVVSVERLGASIALETRAVLIASIRQLGVVRRWGEAFKAKCDETGWGLMKRGSCCLVFDPSTARARCSRSASQSTHFIRDALRIPFDWFEPLFWSLFFFAFFASPW
jgi:hypothetical protein